MTGLWAALLPRLHVTTAITAFLPDAADRRAATLTREIAEGELSSTLVLDVSGPGDLGATTRKLVDRVRALPDTRSVRSGVDEVGGEQMIRLLLERSPTALLRPDDLEDDAVRLRLRTLKSRLASPVGPFVRELARRDPLGGSLDLLDDVSRVDGGLVSRDGILFTPDEAHAFVFAVSRPGAFDAPAQKRWLDGIDAAFRDVRAPEQRLETSGIARMSVAAESQIRGDIERIGGISTIGILVLFGFLFRSLRMLGLGLVPLWFGSALAIIATHLVFGEIHGLTLAFGTSLLGVGIDYAEHYFSHFALTPEYGPLPVMRAIWPGLWMGALTTILGFSGLGVTGFPGVRQIAFFSAVAIVGALVGTRWLLPPWMPVGHRSPPILARLAALAERVLGWASTRRWLVVVPVVLTLALVPGLLRTRFVDDVSVLLAFDPELLAEDARVRSRVSPVDTGRFVVVVDPAEEGALEKLDATTRGLEKARAAGVLERWVPLGSLLRSRGEQMASFSRAQKREERIRVLMREEGLVPELFEPFFDTLRAREPSVLTLDDVRGSALGGVVAPLAPRIAQGQAFVLPLQGVKDIGALRTWLPSAVVIDEARMIEDTYRTVRKNTTWMLLVGLGLVLAVLVWRYRQPRVVLAAFLPGVLGAAGAVSLHGLVGAPLNVLHLIAMLLVLSMGVDFGIFVVEGRASPAEAARSLVSIATATTTTLLSFGLLALSPSPALRTLGITITVGLTLGAVLCPLGLVLLKRDP